MKLMVVGGNFSDDIEKFKQSSVVNKLTEALRSIYKKHVNYNVHYKLNGGNISQLNSAGRISKNYDLNIWMPNVSNTLNKEYPKKSTGNVLICSKVLRKNRTMYDAVGRIFKMHGNAVIAISRNVSSKSNSDVTYKFTLLDALGNVWVDTVDIKKLADGIYRFYEWSQRTKRMGSTSVKLNYRIDQTEFNRLVKFCKINTKVADMVEVGNKNRYFGNCSTRCSLMFPSVRSVNPDYVFVSRRNSNKKRLIASDMLLTTMNKNNTSVIYQGDIKPSVDTPVQLKLYKCFPYINYMIHGHAYIKNAPWSGRYYACGDLREVSSAALHINYTNAGAVNLRNHGFLIYAKTLRAMENYIKQATFVNKIVGKEFV